MSRVNSSPPAVGTTAWGTSLNSHLGDVKTAVNGLGTAADLNVGTSTGTVAAGDDTRITGAVPSTRTINNGYGLTGWGDLSADRTPAVALTKDSGSLGANNGPLATGATTLLTTASLGVGTWLINAGMTCSAGASTANVDLFVTTGTATATFTGQQSASGRPVTNNPVSVSLCAVAVVTVAGTFTIQAQPSAASNITVLAASFVGSTAKATGYTAVRIA